MGTEQQLSRAAECLFMAVESSDADKQTAMLSMAQWWLEQSEQIRNGDQPSPDGETASGAAAGGPAEARPRRSERASAAAKRRPKDRGRRRKTRAG
jgi:hypothetical protein